MQMSLYQLLDQILAFLQNPHAPSVGVLIVIGIILAVILAAIYILWSARAHSHKRPQIYGRHGLKRPQIYGRHGLKRPQIYGRHGLKRHR